MPSSGAFAGEVGGPTPGSVDHIISERDRSVVDCDGTVFRFDESSSWSHGALHGLAKVSGLSRWLKEGRWIYRMRHL